MKSKTPKSTSNATRSVKRCPEAACPYFTVWGNLNKHLHTKHNITTAKVRIDEVVQTSGRMRACTVCNFWVVKGNWSHHIKTKDHRWQVRKARAQAEKKAEDLHRFEKRQKEAAELKAHVAYQAEMKKMYAEARDRYEHRPSNRSGFIRYDAAKVQAAIAKRA